MLNYVVITGKGVMETNFPKQLSTLLVMDLVLTLGDSYVPHSWWPVRDLVSALVLTAMALTMAVTLRRVLEDY